MLPPPKDPNWSPPELSEEDFLNPPGDEDDLLLASGGFDEEDEPEPDEA